jgi:transcriptional regulator with XRE-family HTH domain
VSGHKQPTRTAALSAFLRTRLAELGLSASGASGAAGLERTAIRDIYRGSAPGTHKLAALATALRVPPERLLQLIDAELPKVKPPASARVQTVLDVNEAPMLDRQPYDLPLYRLEPTVDGPAGDLRVAQIARPPTLHGREEAYAVYIADTLNAPLLLPGQIAYVDPSRPPQIGRPARVFLAAGAPLIALLAAQSPTEIQLQVLSEATPRVFPASAVTHLHRIVGFSLLDD